MGLLKLSPFDSGRRHTGLLAFGYPAGEDDLNEIEEKDLRIDTYRSKWSKEGQHVNTQPMLNQITHFYRLLYNVKMKGLNKK